jgi:hypothetical protein
MPYLHITQRQIQAKGYSFNSLITSKFQQDLCFIMDAPAVPWKRHINSFIISRHFNCNAERLQEQDRLAVPIPHLFGMLHIAAALTSLVSTPMEMLMSRRTLAQQSCNQAHILFANANNFIPGKAAKKPESLCRRVALAIADAGGQSLQTAEVRRFRS